MGGESHSSDRSAPYVRQADFVEGGAFAGSRSITHDVERHPIRSLLLCPKNTLLFGGCILENRIMQNVAYSLYRVFVLHIDLNAERTQHYTRKHTDAHRTHTRGHTQNKRHTRTASLAAASLL